MHLIQPLASGVNGAGNGSVDIFQRGTTSYAQYYTDFEATAPVTPTASVALDSNGGGIFYVNQLVTCKVKDSSGNVIRTFTAGDNASAVEVMSDSFTGTAYSGGASGINNPTTLKAILDKWNDSAGGANAIDWKVSVGGAAGVNISTVVAALAGLFFNVKDPTYGAVGDNATDDTSAIQAAITAAGNGRGGIVFFPASQPYRITSQLNVPANVSLMGVGGDLASNMGSCITIDAAAAHALVYASASQTTQFISGLAIRAKQVSSGDLIRTTQAVKLRLDNCYLGNSNTTTGHCLEMLTTAGSRVVCTNVGFEVGGSTSHILSTLGHVTCLGCSFFYPAGAYNGVVSWDAVQGGVAIGCRFELLSITSGTSTIFKAQGSILNGHSIVQGCLFAAPTGGTMTAWQDATTLGNFSESGNSYGSTVLIAGQTEAGAEVGHYAPFYGTRMHREYFVQDDSAAITVDPVNYGVIRVKRTTNANQTITIGGVNAVPPPGTWCWLIIDNSSGGNIATITLTANAAGTTLAVNAGLVIVAMLVVVEFNSKTEWLIFQTPFSGNFAR